jgi:hypothetical protein
MVKSRNSQVGEEVKETYPKLMEWAGTCGGVKEKERSLVVLMEREGKGVVVWAGSKANQPVGHHSLSWSSNFVPYTGEVTLSNE